VSDLREAAEMALEALEEFCEMETMLRPIERRDALRQALAQPEREWVGLTDEERSQIHNDFIHKKTGIWEVCDFCEAKLKEKNT